MSDAFTDCSADVVTENKHLFENLLLKLFQNQSEKNRKRVIDLAISINAEQVAIRLNAFLFFADKFKRGRARLRKNSRFFKAALNGFLNPEKALRSEGIFGEIILNWDDDRRVLKICLDELKKNISYPGLSSEVCTKIGRDDHVTLAGTIGVLIGQSKTPIEFISAISRTDLLMER